MKSILCLPSEPERLALIYFFTQNNLAKSEVALYGMHVGKLVLLKRLCLFIYSRLSVYNQIYLDDQQKRFFQVSMTQMIGRTHVSHLQNIYHRKRDLVSKSNCSLEEFASSISDELTLSDLELRCCFIKLQAQLFRGPFG